MTSSYTQDEIPSSPPDLPSPWSHLCHLKLFMTPATQASCLTSTRPLFPIPEALHLLFPGLAVLPISVPSRHTLLLATFFDPSIPSQLRGSSLTFLSVSGTLPLLAPCNFRSQQLAQL